MDPTPLPALNSVTWRRFGRVPGALTAGAGLLLQVAHPVVGAGVLEHSEFQRIPWKRAYRTHLSTMRFIYGLGSGAHAEGSRLLDLHKSIKGVDTSGRRYHALSPEAYAWVHFTLAQFVVDTAYWFDRPLTGEECEQMWQEFRAVGRALGIKNHHMPVDWAAAQAWFHEIVETRLEATASTYDVLDSISAPPSPSPLIPRPLWSLLTRPVGGLMRLTTLGTMPTTLRERMGIPWTRREQQQFERFARLVRGLMRVLPEPLAYVPLAYFTILRARQQQRTRTKAQSWPAGGEAA